VVALLSLQGAGFFVIAGLLLGLLVVAGRRALLPAAAPFTALLEAIRPLFLPLVSVLAVGTIALSPILQLLLCAALLLVAWHLILLPEGRRYRAALRWRGPLICKLVRPFAVILLIGVPLALLLEGAFTDTPHFDAIGGLATVILALALGVWLAAAVLRAVSYATSWLRAAVALAFVLLGLRVAAAAGFLPGDSHVSGVSPTVFLYVALGLLAFDALLTAIAAKRAREPDSASRGWRTLGPLLHLRSRALPTQVPAVAERWGFSTALMAAMVLLASVVYGLLATNQPGAAVLTPEGERVHPELPRVRPAKQGDPALAREFTPVLALTHDEPWSPVSASSYFTQAPEIEAVTENGPAGTPPKPVTSLDQLERTCPDLVATPCYTLDTHCASGEGRCAKGHPRPERGTNRLYREGALYFRVLHKDEPRRRGKIGARTPNVFADRGPFRDQLSILIQYWFFYHYDEWKASAFAGQLVQRHQGDWEAVTIGLSNERPLFVAYSAHCAGTWRNWGEIEVSGKLPRPWTHPLVAVAEGSHANYPKADQKRSPDWASCSKTLPAGTSTAVSYASNIRDKTEYGWEWYPPAHGWIEADTSRPPMSFPGTWGLDDTTTFENFKSNRLGHGSGPRSPSQQPLWEEPVLKIFCQNYTGPSDSNECEGG
jgi:hypothetical protein